MTTNYEIAVKTSCIGSWVVIVHNDEQLVGTVVDTGDDRGHPKRVRVQRGALQGRVLQPHQYVFKKFLNETEVDD